MKLLRLATTALIRLFFSLLFLTSAVHKLLNWHFSERQWVETFCDWQAYVWFWDQGGVFFVALSHAVPFLLIGITLLELLGGLLILLAVKERFGAFLLLIVLLFSMIVFHPFWFMEGDQREEQLTLFLQALAILGGLLLILLNGILPPPSERSRERL